MAKNSKLKGRIGKLIDKAVKTPEPAKVRREELKEQWSQGKTNGVRKQASILPPAVPPTELPAEEGAEITTKFQPKKSAVKPEETPVTIENTRRLTNNFVQLTVEGSNGKKYNITVPKSYVRNVPKVWEWNEDRYRVAELLADGVAIKNIALDPEIKSINNHMTIYGLMEHPEFQEHVNGLVLETGFASKRERIAGLKRVSEKLYDKLIRELGSVSLTKDKYALNAILTGLSTMLKQLAQEKEEFVEQSAVRQEVSGTFGVATINLDEVMLNTATDAERKKLEAEFNEIGDSIIRSLTGQQAEEDGDPAVIDVDGKVE